MKLNPKSIRQGLSPKQGIFTMGSNRTDSRKLRNFFISKNTQRPLLLAHIAYLLLVSTAVIAAVLSPFYFDMYHANDLAVRYFSAKMFMVLMERIGLTSLLVLILSFFHFVIITHKIGGPLVNIGHTIRRMSRRDFTRMVYLRKGDFLQNEAHQINTMMEELSRSIELIRRENRLLCNDLEASLTHYGKYDEIDSRLKGLKDRADRCRFQLDSFRLINDGRTDSRPCQNPMAAGDTPIFAD